MLGTSQLRKQPHAIANPTRLPVRTTELQTRGPWRRVASDLATLWRQRDLLRTWISREISVRYKRAALGAAWAVAQPLALMVAFSVIFTSLVRIPMEDVPYPIFSYVALVPWTFFATAVTTASTSLINNMALVTRISFPREILPFAQIGAAGVDFAVSALLLAVLMVYFGTPIGWSALLVPILFLIQLALMGGVVLITSALTVSVRDVRFVVPLALQLLMYATPIIYPASLVPASWRWVIDLNPMAVIIEGYRSVLLYGRAPDWQPLGVAAMASLVLLVAGYVYFKRVEASFADII
jgi:lipopolysaccharide transport system permease protein